MKGNLWGDLRAGAACPPPLLHPLFLPVLLVSVLGLSALRGRASGPEQNAAEIFFQDGAGVMQEAESRGNAVRGSLFVVACVAGVLPFTVKAAA